MAHSRGTNSCDYSETGEGDQAWCGETWPSTRLLAEMLAFDLIVSFPVVNVVSSLVDER